MKKQYSTALAAFILGLFGFMISFGSSSALAYEFTKVSFDPVYKKVVVEVTYPAGCKTHEWSVVPDSCDTSATPYGKAVRLVDSGWDDTCMDRLDTVTFEFSKEALLCPTDGPIAVTFFAGYKRRTIEVP